MDMLKILETTQSIGDITQYIESGYTIIDLIKSGVFNNYGIGNIFHKTYGPYTIEEGACVKIIHETDNNYTRILQISYIKDGKRVIDGLYNYSIAMEPTTTSISKIRSSTGLERYDTYITVLFQKSHGVLEPENGIMIVNKSYIVQSYDKLKMITPLPRFTQAYCIEQNCAYQYNSGNWEQKYNTPASHSANNANYDWFHYVEIENTEIIGVNQTMVCSFSPVADFNDIFLMVSQTDDEGITHNTSYTCTRYLDKVTITNTHNNPCLTHIRLYLCYNNEEYSKEYYKSLVNFAVYNGYTTTTTGAGIYTNTGNQPFNCLVNTTDKQW